VVKGAVEGVVAASTEVDRLIAIATVDGVVTAALDRDHIAARSEGDLVGRAVTYPTVSLTFVTSFHIRAWLLHEANRGISGKTRFTQLCALRSFYRYLISERLVELSPAAEVNIPSPTLGRVEFYSNAEADDIIEWASSQHSVRWRVGRVILLTLHYTGLRLSELINLRTDEVDLVARRISLVGKGRKPRVIPIPELLAVELREYVQDVRSTLPASPFFFVNPLNYGPSGKFGRLAIHNLVRSAGVQAGVSGRHFPHRWRHTYATSLIRRGEDIHVVQRLMGHSNIATTTRYLHLSDADLSAAVDRAFGVG
jgi:integrase/recombinase XerD